MQHALASLLGTVRRTVARHGLVARGHRVLVAVSGGPDSVGLLATLSELRRRLGIELVVGHVNHGLRGHDSAADEDCARANAERHGVEFVRSDLPASLRTGANIEARARGLRYRALHELASGSGCSRIATGHTLEDQAETVLLRLTRGTGQRGLAAIRPRRADGVIRPLIDCPRAGVLAVVRGLGLPYREDASNRDTRFRRTVIRYQVLPILLGLNPQASRALAGAAARMGAVESIVREWVDGALGSLCEDGRLDVAGLSRFPLALRADIVHAWLSSQSSLGSRVSARHVQAVLGLASRVGGSASVRLPGGLVARRSYGLLALEEDRVDPAPQAALDLSVGECLSLPGGWRLRADPMMSEAGGDGLPGDLWSAVCELDAARKFRIRTPRRGDRVRPLGLGGARRLAEIFIDRKVPAHERRIYPVVEIDGEILWVPGVVRAELVLVTAAGVEGVRLCAERDA